jgi:queuine tRNA-ribosyltransferase
VSAQLLSGQNERNPDPDLHSLRPSVVLDKGNVNPPVYKVPRAPHESALRKFAAVPDETVTILGPRRVPPVICPISNTSTAISILTSHGFTQLEAARYTNAVQQLRPDIVIGFADVEPGKKQGVKRREKVVHRTHAFTRDATQQLYHSETEQGALQKTLYFAPVLPLENTQQRLYLAHLADELRQDISGLALYDTSSLSVIPKELDDLPRLCLCDPKTPQEVLRGVALGTDIFTIPFVGEASDAGIALNFSFCSPDDTEGESNPKPLGIDFWSPIHRVDLFPLSPDCVCYTCKRHHRAYLHHLLSAKEMVAWTLLQIHNHHTMDLFFQAVRESIADGTFSVRAAAFERNYVSELPEKTGSGPRYVHHRRFPPSPNPQK